MPNIIVGEGPAGLDAAINRHKTKLRNIPDIIQNAILLRHLKNAWIPRTSRGT